MSLTSPRLSSAALAIVTTLHMAIAAARLQRRADLKGGLLAALSSAFVAAPWVWPSVWGLVFGLGLHALWFGLCERIARPHAQGVLTTGGAAAAADYSAPRRPRGFSELSVIAVNDEAPGIRRFRFRRPEGFEFVAGQFLTLRVPVDGVDHVRCYSISSAPAARDHLDITVKAQGLVSRAIHAGVTAGSLVSVRAPAGAFVYPAEEGLPLVLIAGGIGITPVLSMLRHAVVAEPSRAVTLLYSARTEAGLAFREELTSLAGRHAPFRLFMAVTSEEAGAGLFPGRIDETLLRAAVPDVADSIACLCGPQSMIDALGTTLRSLGVPANRIRAEVFEAAVAAGGGKDARRAAHAAAEGPAHQMRCARLGSAVSVSAGQTLLEAAEAAGVTIDSICRAGVCGTCRTRVIDGAVRCESSLLDDIDREDGFVLACVTHVDSDCTVEV